MGAETVPKRVIISNAPFGWIHKLAAGDPAGSITELYRFDNLSDSEIKLTVAEASGSGDNVDIKRGDGAVWRFSKFNIVLSGVDETDITPASQGSDASSKAVMTITTNEAPLPVTITSMTLWLKDLVAKKGDLLMITLPVGFTYDARTNQGKVDGFVRMLGKLNNDIDLKTNDSPSTIALEFVSYKCTLAGVDDVLIEAATYTGIVWKGKAITITPPNLSVGDGDELIAGNVVFAQSATYSYTP
jgi:hypothetical protein